MHIFSFSKILTDFYKNSVDTLSSFILPQKHQYSYQVRQIRHTQTDSNLVKTKVKVRVKITVKIGVKLVSKLYQTFRVNI